MYYQKHLIFTNYIDHLGELPKCNNNLLIDCETDEEQWLIGCINETFSICDKIIKVYRVNHKQMYGLYLLRKAELQLKHLIEERILYHVTSESNAITSLNDGLNWRKTKRAKFGAGVSFSDDANYANFYASNQIPGNRVILVCSVLIGNVYRLKPLKNKKAVHNIKYPPDGFDTTISSSQRVYVKYNDYEFYPKYIVYYNKPNIEQCRLLKEENEKYHKLARSILASEYSSVSKNVKNNYSTYSYKYTQSNLMENRLLKEKNQTHFKFERPISSPEYMSVTNEYSNRNHEYKPNNLPKAQNISANRQPNNSICSIL